MWTEQQVKTSLQFMYRELESQRYELNPDLRLYGAAEAFLRCVEKIPSGALPYKQIEYKTWRGKIKTKKERYTEMIFRLTYEFITT